MAVAYFAITMLYISIVALGSKTAFEDPIYVRLYLYSLIFPLYCLAWGIATRLVSCKIEALVYSFALMMIQLIITLYSFRWIYSLDYGISNLGWSYVVMCATFMVIPHAIIHLIIALIDRTKSRKIVKKIAARKHSQKSVNEPRILKVYNKKNNRYEKYLLWKTKTGKWQSSERIIYFDFVELLAVDSNHNVYAFVERPTKIKLKEYLAKEEV